LSHSSDVVCLRLGSCGGRDGCCCGDSIFHAQRMPHVVRRRMMPERFPSSGLRGPLLSVEGGLIDLPVKSYQAGNAHCR
jgi:hypothetical protein